MSVELFSSIGLSEQKASETVKNKKLCAFLQNIIEEAEKSSKNGILPSEGMLLYQLASRLKPQCYDKMPYIVTHIMNKNIRNDDQLSAALNYVLERTGKGKIVEKQFFEACGVGVVITEEQIEEVASQVVQKNNEELLKFRYNFKMGKLLGEAKKSLKWVDAASLKQAIDFQVLTLLGPKTADEMMGRSIPVANGLPDKKPEQKPVKQKPAKPDKVEDKKDLEEDGASSIEELMRCKVHLHKPGDNYKMDGYVCTPKTHNLLKEHLKLTGGKVVTRFPPEPNGILHIGHAKAININFGYAKAFDGVCYLRYDDTNPEKEEEKYFVGIKDMVEWLGYTPYKITHSSDYFGQLHAWAVKLIEKDLAYVCHQHADDMKGFNPPPSPWRNRPIKESLTLFRDMKRGKFDEGEATLRLKLTLEEGKVDPVAYRIKFVPHHRTGNEWCVYPTYDYTHCLCDSIENISHSLCTKEFQSRRSSYYWLCNALDVYCPVQWEYARLNLSYTVVSKRKILKLVDCGIVKNWDDPRLFTLTALKRRGFPAQAINNFVAKMGLTTAQTVVDPCMLEACVRDVLNVTAPRCMAVLSPIKVVISNYTDSLPNSVPVPDFPAEPERGSHTVPFDRVIYIDSDDFREEGDKQYRRWTPNQSVGLKHVGVVLNFKQITQRDSAGIREISAECVSLTTENKPKGFIHWVAKPIKCQVRLYRPLFKHKNPEDSDEVPGGFITDCVKDSLEVIDDALVDVSVQTAKVFDKYQFERIGFFSVDPDSDKNKLVFNRTVLLKEDSTKKS